MLGLAGIPLEIEMSYYTESAVNSVSKLGETTLGRLDDWKKLESFCQSLDVLTYESENIPVETVRKLESLVKVYPDSRALEISQDRWLEKNFFSSLGIGTARTFPVSSEADIKSLSGLTLKTGGLLKTRRDGYDGKNQVPIGDIRELENAWSKLGRTSSVLEERVTFVKEVSCLSVSCFETGELAQYPLIENQHKDGILRRSMMPASLSKSLSEKIYEYSTRAVKELSYTGLLAIEFFCLDDDILANEMAPRVHNSGHLTLEGCVVSQFENHLRAICGWPLGSTFQLQPVEMENILSTKKEPKLYFAENKYTKVHLYDKEERDLRKLGHLVKLSPGRLT